MDNYLMYCIISDY